MSWVGQTNEMPRTAEFELIWQNGYWFRSLYLIKKKVPSGFIL
jgi:hypothetical protein